MPVSVCSPFERPLAALVSLLQKMPVFSLLFLQCFKLFHTVDYLSMVAKGSFMLITRIYAVQSNTDLKENLRYSFQR